MKSGWQALPIIMGAGLLSSGVAAAEQGAPVPQQATTSSAVPEDLNLLVGKKVIVGRMALCIPNSYTPNLAYAGKPAVVAAFKPQQALTMSAARFPPAMRAQIADMKKGGVLLFQFEDGTKLDTCVPQGLSALSPNLELAPGETVALPQPSLPSQSVTANSGRREASTRQQCPATVLKVASGNSFAHILVDSLTTSELERQVDQAGHGGVGKHYLDVQVRNDSGRPIKAFEFSTVYADKMGDEAASAAYVSQNAKPIPRGSVFKTSAMDRGERTQSGAGEVSVFISRIRFEDDSYWQDDGSRSCSLKAAVK